MTTERNGQPTGIRWPALLCVIACLALPAAAFASDSSAAGSGIDIQHWETDNGARVLFVHAPELPIVDVQVVFDAGSARDADLPGLAQLTSRLLEHGAGALDADAIAEGFEDIGARFSSESHRDMAIVNLRSLSDADTLTPALETLALVLRDPTFPEPALERERNRLLTALQREAQSPGSIATNTFFEAVYGDHPYASNPLGSDASLAAITRDNIRDFHRRYYVARNAVIAVVGALERDAAGRLAEQLSRGLPTGEPAPVLPAPPAIEEGRHVHVEFPSSQTHIVAGQAGLRRDDPDYFPLYVGNHALGGSGLVSRISGEIRDKRGLAYSSYSYFTPMRAAGPFRLGLQTRNDQANEAVEVLFETVEAFVADGPDDDELTASVRNITGGFPLRIASNRDIAGNLAVIGFYGLPLDHLDRFNQQVEAVTLAQIRDAFQRRIDPARMITVTVGQAANQEQ